MTQPRRLRFSLRVVVAVLVVAGAALAWQFRRLDPGRQLDARGVAVVEALRAVPADTWVQTLRYESLSLRAWLVGLMNRFAPAAWNSILVREYPREWRQVLKLIDNPDQKRDVTADPFASLEPQLRALMESMHLDGPWTAPPEWQGEFERIHLPAADPAALVRVASLNPQAIISVRADGERGALGTAAHGDVRFITVGHPWEVDGVQVQQGNVVESPYRLYRADSVAPSGITVRFSVLLPATP